VTESPSRLTDESGADSGSIRLDGREPERVFEPSTEAEARDLVLEAASAGIAIVPVGGGTGLGTGNLLRADSWGALRTSRLTRIVEYSPDDMVVTAEAGVTLETLQNLLAEHNQFLPVDAPYPEQATLGGITATNAQGLLRPAFGLPRDRLLGARMALSDGTVIRAGGKVVKNVAGYDLCKLVAGSWGTLGLITEVTYKTNPLPPCREEIRFSADMMLLAEAALRVHEARLQPVYMTAYGPACPELKVGLMGSGMAVSWQRKAITEALVALGLSPTVGETRGSAGAGSSVAARLTVKPTDIPAVLGILATVTSEVVSHIPTGVIECAFADAAPDDAMGVARWTAALRDRLPAGSHLVWTRVPAQWKRAIDVWGPTRPDHSLMRGIKDAFDLRGLFSPGRFAGRL
jgi:glycolate oxidase FAD binding subunit